MKTAQIAATYMDHMGTDLTVVNAARASFDKESGWAGECPSASTIYQEGKGYLREADAKLIRFLARGYRTGEWDELVDYLAGEQDGYAVQKALLEFKNRAQHWAPFAHPQLQLRVTMPIFLARQMVKHQVGGTWSEVSRRYVSDEPTFWFPEEWHARPEDVKQGSGAPVATQRHCHGVAQRVVEHALTAYQQMLDEGVAPEEARIILPQNTMTTVVWTGSLLFWARLCLQRLDGHAQLAAQELAQKIEAIVEPRYPVSWKELTK